MPKRKTNDVQTDITPAETPPPYNLWFEPWITLERPTGEMEQHGIEYALLNTHQFRAIYDPSPLVVVGIHRLLTAILQDALDPRNEDELHDLWQSGAFPPDSIRQFGIRYVDRFDLFSRDKPFMQSADLPLAPTKGDQVTGIAKLFAEVPSGKSEVAFYQHVSDAEQVFSPAAVAAGLMTIPPFVSSQGRSYFPSINGVPPIYVIPGGGTLFESLCTSLLIPLFRPPMASRKQDNCWWKRDDPVVQRSSAVTEIGYLHSLTFPARRIRLHPAKVDTYCTRTGRFTEWGVRTMIFEMGENRPKDAPYWQDPFVAYRLPAEKRPSQRLKAGSTAKKKDQPVPIQPERGKASWREFGSLFLTREDTARQTERPLVIQQMAKLNLAGNRRALPFRCVGILTDRAKNLEWLDFGFDVPPSLLNDPKGATQADKAIVFADNCGSIISSVFSRQFGGDSRKSERHRTTKDRMLADYWSTLGLYFRNFILELGDQERQADAYSAWISIVVNTANAMFAQAAESIGDDAVNLRKRVEGEQHCSYQLNKRKRKEMPHE